MGDPVIGLGAVDALSGVHSAVLAIDGQGETGLDRFRLAHRALPGLDLAEVSLRTRLLGAELAAPLVLAGDDRALARTATEHGLGLIANELAPDRPPLWLASFDMTALRGDGPERAERLVAALEADGLVLNLNGMDDPRMRGAEEAIAEVVERLAPLPVVARGAGYGIDAADARALRAAGVAAIDVGGAARPGWGVPTADAVCEALLGAPDLPILAEVAGAVDAAKCLALGAAAVSLAADDVATVLEELRLAVWAAGARSPAELTPGHLRGGDPWRPPPA
jgi:isopentenyl-diphosphate Delta-isomerase